jgi:predicted DNA-binding ribbon-helix-helix protein
MRKHSVKIAGHPTSISLEDEFWQELKAIAAARDISLNELITGIDGGHTGNLSSALRVFVLKEIRKK